MYVLELGHFSEKSPKWWQNFANAYFDNDNHLIDIYFEREFNKVLKKNRGKFKVDWAKQRKLLRFKSEEDALLFLVRWS